MKTILAALDLLKIEIISFCSNEVRLVVKTRLLKSTCPSCGWQSDKAHSRYQRHLADLPWEGVAVKLINGQVEGQINRLKTVKRTMFGRANFDLLRSRTLRAAA